MMKVKVSELEGRALNWAVASVLYGQPSLVTDRGWGWTEKPNDVRILKNPNSEFRFDDFNPSGNWAHTGILIDEFRLTIRDLRHYREGKFLVSCEYTGEDDDYTVDAEPHKDAKIAICRAVCMTENGKDEIEIPDELMENIHAK